ncbi:hypothetical protein [Pedobacter panaciterrae]
MNKTPLVVFLMLMILSKRTIDFSHLLAKIETIRLNKAQYTYHTYLKEFAGIKCALCELPLNPYGIYLNLEQAICIQCFNHYISAKDHLHQLALFEAKVLRVNKLADDFMALLKNDPPQIDLDLANRLFIGLSLAETEQMIGLPQNFGSFDFGVEAGTWKVSNFRMEIWFKNQICTEVLTV